MKPIDLFMQFFRREGWIYAIGLTMLMAIDVAFLFVPQFIGNACLLYTSDAADEL